MTCTVASTSSAGNAVAHGQEITFLVSVYRHVGGKGTVAVPSSSQQGTLESSGITGGVVFLQVDTPGDRTRSDEHWLTMPVTAALI